MKKQHAWAYDKPGKSIFAPKLLRDLSDKLEIKHSTINSVLKRLEKDRFIVWEKYGKL